MDKKEEDLFPSPNQSHHVKAGKRKGNPAVILLGLAVLLVLAIFVVRPAVLGYGIYQQAQTSNLSVQDYAQSMQELSRDLEVAQTNLSTYSTFTGALLAQVEEKNDELIECKVQLERVQSQVGIVQKEVENKEAELSAAKSAAQTVIDQEVTEKTASLEQEKAACEASLSDKEKAVGEVQAKYDQVIKNAAKSICCKAKVDNPEINFYDVVDNTITCLTQGPSQLNC